MPYKNCFVSSLFFLFFFGAFGQFKVPQFPSDFNALVLDYPLKSPAKRVRETSITQSVKYDGQPITSKDAEYHIKYAENGDIKNYQKIYGDAVYNNIDYLHLNKKLYREIDKVGNAYLVTQYYYAGDKVNCKQFLSKPESDKMVDILASQNDLPLENYTIEKERGDKIEVTRRLDHKRDINYTEKEAYFKSIDTQFPYRIKKRSDANTSFSTWEYTYTNFGEISSATHLKSKVIAVVYTYTYYPDKNLKSISKKIDNKEIAVLELFYGNDGLLRSCLVSNTSSKELLLTDFRYKYYE